VDTWGNGWAFPKGGKSSSVPKPTGLFVFPALFAFHLKASLSPLIQSEDFQGRAALIKGRFVSFCTNLTIDDPRTGVLALQWMAVEGLIL